MLGLHLGHLATGEVKNFFAEQFEDDHVVLTEALAGPTRTHNVTDEGGPVFGPFLLQDLKQVQRRRALCQQPHHNLPVVVLVSNNHMFIHLYEDHVEFGNVHSLLLHINRTVTSLSSSTKFIYKVQHLTTMSLHLHVCWIRRSLDDQANNIFLDA